MCIIAVKPADKPMFADAGIRQMFSRNRDGAGLMWTENETVHIKKGLMAYEDVIDFVHSREWDGIPVVLHFRIGTAGPNNEINCHPYPIYKKNKKLELTCDLAMAHNGVMAQYNPPRSSSINDTQVFINTVVSKLPKNFLKNEAICRLIEREVAPSRLCFLDKKGTITRFGHWIEEDGYFYSNESFRIPKYSSIPMDDCWRHYSSKDVEKSKLFDISDLSYVDNEEFELEAQEFSFSPRFEDDMLLCDSDIDFRCCVEELESKCDCIDENIFGDDVYIYEIDQIAGAIYRWEDSKELWPD